MKLIFFGILSAAISLPVMADALEAGAAGAKEVRIGAAMTQAGYVHAVGVRPRAKTFTRKVALPESMDAENMADDDERMLLLLKEAAAEAEAMEMADMDSAMKEKALEKTAKAEGSVDRADLSIYAK